MMSTSSPSFPCQTASTKPCAVADLETMGRVFESPFDGSEQTVATPGSKWLMELTMGKMEPAVARRLEAFIAKRPPHFTHR